MKLSLQIVIEIGSYYLSPSQKNLVTPLGLSTQSHLARCDQVKRKDQDTDYKAYHMGVLKNYQAFDV